VSTQVTQVSPSSLASAPHSGPGQLQRLLNAAPWWLLPATVVAVLGLFSLYSIWTAFLTGGINQSGSYLSPFYSPTIWTTGPVSPALWVLGSPLLFRATCYYYRKAYYRSFAGSPPGCAVGPLAGKRTYRGETAVLLFQNLHRFAMYFALLFIVLLGKDAVESFFRDGRPGIGVGSIILTINVVLIASYTFGCHSFRHLIGGRKDCMSDCGRATVALGTWKRSTWFNVRHMQFAWLSLVWVMVSDLYIRLLSMGVIRDFHTW